MPIYLASIILLALLSINRSYAQTYSGKVVAADRHRAARGQRRACGQQQEARGFHQDQGRRDILHRPPGRVGDKPHTRHDAWL